MKHHLLILLFFTFSAAALPAQTILETFENTSLTWSTVSCGAGIVENPHHEGLNLSYTVLQLTRAVGCDNWSGAIHTPQQPLTGYKYVHVLMYRNNTNLPNLKVSDNLPEGVASCDLEPITPVVAGEWQDVVFDISAFPQVDFLMLMIDRTDIKEEAVMYCDQIVLSNSPLPSTEVITSPQPDPDPVVTPLPGENGTGEKDGYQLVWADYFNQPDLDTRCWTIEVNGDGGGNNELQYYTDRTDNVHMGIEPESGRHCLILTAKKEEYNGKHFTSGRLISKDKVYFTHGKVEALIYLPYTANGLWPAFWMMGNDITQVGWPKCGETDILEMGHGNGITNGKQDRYFNGASHWGTRWDDHRQHAQDYTNHYSMQGGFHLYTCYWDEQSMRMYLDHDQFPDVEPYYAINISQGTDPADYFHKPNFILFNLAVGGNFPGIWKPELITALAEDDSRNMYIDYVKVYQQTPSIVAPDISAVDNLQAQQLLQNTCVTASLRFTQTIDQVALYSLSGACLMTAQSVASINMEHCAAGMYIVKLNVNNQTVMAKIIKQ